VRIKYEDWKPGVEASQVIAQANAICRDYQQQGFDLTLRQLYYQFVARDLIPNTQQSYKRLGDIINKARLAGLLDWDYIVDRTRNLRGNSHWDTPESIIRSAARSFAIDKWAGQPRRVEVWVEKDALAGIVGRVAGRADVDYFACRGYVSQSELWSAAQRQMRYIAAGQGVTVLHLGDHDPSGIDMTRDIRDRLQNFLEVDWLNAHADDFEGTSVLVKEIRAAMEGWVGGEPIEVRRIALNYDQVEQYSPPPNPAKLTDSRASSYVRDHGFESWELDALDPTTLANLIQSHIDDIQDPDLYFDKLREEQTHRELLDATSARWGEVVDMLAGGAA
jgi:hypothetical protein